MEPLSVLSALSSVFQLVDFSTKFTKQLSEIYLHPVIPNTLSQAEVHQFQVEALALHRDLTATLAHAPDENGIVALVEESKAVSEELLALLEKLYLRGKQKSTIWARAGARVKVKLHQDEIRNTALRVEDIRHRLQMLLNTSLQVQTQDVINATLRASELLAQLDSYSKSAVTALVDEQIRTGTSSNVDFLASAGRLVARVEGRVTDPTKSEESIRRTVEEVLLTSLGFDVSTNRMSAISAPSPGTFEWVFQQPEDPSWSSLLDFLSGDGGLYWIKGNEASGKSTLMKYIFTHEETRSHLRKWAGSTELVSAAFFFWIGGSRLVKSQEGLLRSLLFTILRAHPHLTPDIFPHEWAVIYNQLSRGAELASARIDTWSTTLLRQAFSLLSKQQQYPLKVFILVDALDEYEGHGLPELVKLFVDQVSQSSNFKILFSSRSLEDFDVFKARELPSLTLHELNRPDIEILIHKNLESNEDFRAVAQDDPANAAQVVKHILNESNGLFLWVDLVIRAVLTQLSSGTNLEDILESLRRGLGSAHLHQLYEHMWGKISTKYRPQASRVLQIVLASRDIREVNGAMADNDEPLSVMDLVFAEGDPKETIAMPIKFWPDDFIQIKCDQLVGKFTTIWQGFLTVSEKTKTTNAGVIPPAHIQYAHRSAMEFWSGEHGRRLLAGVEQDVEFSPYLAHLKSAVHHLKVLPDPLPPRPLPLLWNLITAALVAANKVEQGTIPASYSPLLETLDHVMTHHHKKIQTREGSYTYQGTPGLPSIQDGGEKSNRLAQLHWSNIFHHSPNIAPSPRHTMRCKDSFLSLLTQFGLQKELQTRLQTAEGNAKLHGKSGRPLLSYALDPHPFARYELITADTVKLLLDQGADPNKKFNKTTSWQDALRWQHQELAVHKGRNVKGAAENRELARIRLQIIDALVEKVDSPNTKVKLPSPTPGQGERLVEAKQAVKEALGVWLNEDEEENMRNLYRALIQRMDEEVQAGGHGGRGWKFWR